MNRERTPGTRNVPSRLNTHDPRLTIVGLGPGDPGLLTLEAAEALAQAAALWLRTDHHPLVPALRAGLGGRLRAGLVIESFDPLYVELPDLEAVYEGIAARLLELSAAGPVTYAVPGSPSVAERSVELMLQRAAESGLEVRLVQGISFVEVALAAVGVAPATFHVVDAAAVAGAEEALRPLEALFSPEQPLVICQLDSPRLASHVKLALMELYPDEHPVTLVRAPGRTLGATESVGMQSVPLFELDRQAEIDYLTTVYVPPLEPLQNLSSWIAAEHIVSRLRAPGGCPWDRKQTHASLKRYLLEEAYEALEAIDAEEHQRLAGELGDILLQVLLHARLANETGAFDLRRIVRHLSEKLIRRHPHVFGDVQVTGAEEVVANWEKLKQAEREAGQSALSGVPHDLPQLARCQAISQRAAQLGFEWEDLAGVWNKVEEELGELRSASDVPHRSEELGDLLFTVVQLARWMDIDAEEALRAANTKFVTRFQALERLVGDRPMSSYSPAELEALWEQAKRAARA